MYVCMYRIFCLSFVPRKDGGGAHGAGHPIRLDRIDQHSLQKVPVKTDLKHQGRLNKDHAKTRNLERRAFQTDAPDQITPESTHLHLENSLSSDLSAYLMQRLYSTAGEGIIQKRPECSWYHQTTHHGITKNSS
jgi:hypothetical protein